MTKDIPDEKRFPEKIWASDEHLEYPRLWEKERDPDYEEVECTRSGLAAQTTVDVEQLQNELLGEYIKSKAFLTAQSPIGFLDWTLRKLIERGLLGEK